MTARLRSFLASRLGAVGAEFALIVPLFTLIILGVIDCGRLLWTWNRAEKATQMGARYAAATDMIPAGLASYDFYTDGIARGDSIPQTNFGGATCSSTGCTCNTGATCPSLGTWDSAAQTRFQRVVTRMQDFLPEIQATNVQIEYGYSGLGYSGDPYGPDVAPLITVRLTGMTYQPTLGYLFGGSLALPAFATTLSMEDGVGTLSN